MSYGTRGYGGSSSASKPVEVGMEYEVDVTEISRRGDGVARIQGFIVFIENGKIGNKVKVKINQVGDRFAKATVV